MYHSCTPLLLYRDPVTGFGAINYRRLYQLFMDPGAAGNPMTRPPTSSASNNKDNNSKDNNHKNIIGDNTASSSSAAAASDGTHLKNKEVNKEIDPNPDPAPPVKRINRLNDILALIFVIFIALIILAFLCMWIYRICCPGAEGYTGGRRGYSTIQQVRLSL